MADRLVFHGEYWMYLLALLIAIVFGFLFYMLKSPMNAAAAISLTGV